MNCGCYRPITNEEALDILNGGRNQIQQFRHLLQKFVEKEELKHPSCLSQQDKELLERSKELIKNSRI